MPTGKEGDVAEDLTVREVEWRIDSHEEVCSLRYKMIHESLDTLNKKIEKMDNKFNWFIAALVVGMAGTITSICLAFFNVYVKAHGV